ncbi:Hydrogenase-4 component B [hydrothermal vent metagenome]|uniref:Hydrogenase-4 component B n=1 Tax=hydrothermal vent metagenome TaxID=652676 RepID=A0A3B1A7V9_9ZZZZ
MPSFLYLSILLPIASAVISLLSDRYSSLMSWIIFPLLGLSGIFAIYEGMSVLITTIPQVYELPLGLPWLPWQIKLDPLSGLFLSIIGLVTLAISFFGPGYIREFTHGKQPLAVLGFFTGLFITGMILVVIANDAFSFMVSWELMSLSSYFLVAYQHQNASNRRAAFLYLLMAHVGGILILLSFGVLAGFGGGLTFDAMRAAPLELTWSSIAFVLGLLGFGMKAGLVPIHTWLPEAHPVAPSHISSLMSGVMLKVAIYGFIRVTFDLIGDVHWGWGVAVLIMASITAIFGVLYALVQTDIKKLLAYSSIENVGIIFIGLGLSMIFFGTQHPTLGVLGLIASLYHSLNHSIFKSLLFLGAGSIIQRTREKDMERLGGLINRMPWTALYFLIACISIASLPPFNGFVSEWLTFQTALQAVTLESGVLRAIIPISAAVLALTGALGAACFVRLYGISFLGKARSKRARTAHEANIGMGMAQGLLAIFCILLGIFPSYVIDLLNAIPTSLMNQSLTTATEQGWLWLTPISAEKSSYSAPLVAIGIVIALFLWATAHKYLLPKEKYPMERKDTWDCGFGGGTSRMQYTGSAFSEPFRRIFKPVWRLTETVEREPKPNMELEPASVRHKMHVEDITWNWLYLPIAKIVHNAAKRITRIQTGHLRHYLAYSFSTLILLLWMIT